MRSGEFAKLCNTTKNTLIHYDELGILRPSQRGGNRYREYTMGDYMTFVTIRALVDAGFPLREVGRLLDAPDPSALIGATEANLASIDARMEELARSRRLLQEIDRQARGLADFRPGRVRLQHRGQGLLLLVQDERGLQAGDDLTPLYKADLKAAEMLARLGAEAQIAPYGLTASAAPGGEPVYEALYYLLPPDCDGGDGLPLEPVLAGTYAQADFEGDWGDVGMAYLALDDFVRRENLKTTGVYYETAQMRLLNADSDSYRCRVSVRVS